MTGPYRVGRCFYILVGAAIGRLSTWEDERRTGRPMVAPTGAEEAGPWERSADIDVGTVVPDGPFPYGADMQSRGGSGP